MAVSRPLLLALVGAILMTSTFLAARGARTAAEPAPAAAVAPAPSPTQGNVAGGKAGPAKGAQAGDGKAGEAAKRSDDKAKAGAKQKAEAANKPAEKALAERQPAKVVGLPAPVAQALANKKVVVLFFFQNAADDDATGTAVNSLRGIRGVKIFRDGITNLAKYRAVTAGLGVAQAPAVVVVGRDRKAQLLEGYVDKTTLTQIVVDAR